MADPVIAIDRAARKPARRTTRRLLTRRHLVAALATLFAIAFASLTSAGSALAHSGLGAASPAPGSRVGGEITEIQLRYSSTVADVEGSVTDPDGNVVESDWVQDGNLRVVVSLAEPLSIPGQYAVRHISSDVEDGDRVEAAFLFTYDPAAPPPQLEIVPDDDNRFPWIWIVVGVGVVVVDVLAWRLYRSMRRARQATPTT